MLKKYEDHKIKVIEEIKEECTFSKKELLLEMVQKHDNQNYGRFLPPAYQVEDDFRSLIRGTADEDLKDVIGFQG